MNLDEFCQGLETQQLSTLDNALAVLWFHDERSPDVQMTAGELSRIIHKSGLGTPHSTKLAAALQKSGLLLKSGDKFALKALSRAKIRPLVEPILGVAQPKVDQDMGYLPKQVWSGTRGYIEKVCVQLNGCYQFGFYDAASVLARRLIETLIIEGYEAQKREAEIRDFNGNFFMLNGLILAANGSPGIGLGRDAKKLLAELKELGIVPRTIVVTMQLKLILKRFKAECGCALMS